jgi:hypothetical protein
VALGIGSAYAATTALLAVFNPSRRSAKAGMSVLVPHQSQAGGN